MEEADTSAPEDGAAADAAERRGGFGSLGSIIYLLVLTWAAGIASFPLNDNSFFTHLATGRLIFEEGSVPSTDPYTFTAFGEPWTVQSWLASVAYAGFERLAGDVGLRFLVLSVFVTAMTVLWKLTRPAESILVRLALLGLALMVVTDLWSERPYMIGVIGLGVVWLALEGHVRPWLLIPLMWIWVNTHGSFLLAGALVCLYIGGAALDRRVRREIPAVTAVTAEERKVAGATFLGVVLGAISPVGPKILWFPLTAMSKSDVFGEIIEWRPPAYQSIAERAFLILLVLTVLMLARKGSWRLTLPAVLFGAGAVFAQRNVVMATVVLLAVAARSAGARGTLRAGDRPALGPAVGVVFGFALVVVSVVALLSPVDGYGGYPVRALSWVDSVDVEGRMAAQIQTGNLLEVLDGERHSIFIDDRVDMFPQHVFRAYLDLLAGRSSWQAILDRYDVNLIMWSRDEPLGSLAAESDDWAIVYSDSEWIVSCRRSACGHRGQSDQEP